MRRTIKNLDGVSLKIKSVKLSPDERPTALINGRVIKFIKLCSSSGDTEIVRGAQHKYSLLLPCAPGVRARAHVCTRKSSTNTRLTILKFVKLHYSIFSGAARARARTTAVDLWPSLI